MCIIICLNCDYEWDLEKFPGCPECGEDQNNNQVISGEEGIWEGYIHSNGSLRVNRMIKNKGVNINSPFVLKYLGTLPCASREQAENLFKVKGFRSIVL